MDTSMPDDMATPDEADSALLTRTAGAHDELFTVVLCAVAEVSDASVTDLPPVLDVVDPDALEDLFPPGQDEGQVVFRYGGYTIAVGADRTVRVYGAPASES